MVHCFLARQGSGQGWEKNISSLGCSICSLAMVRKNTKQNNDISPVIHQGGSSHFSPGRYLLFFLIPSTVTKVVDPRTSNKHMKVTSKTTALCSIRGAIDERTVTLDLTTVRNVHVQIPRTDSKEKNEKNNYKKSKQSEHFSTFLFRGLSMYFSIHVLLCVEEMSSEKSRRKGRERDPFYWLDWTSRSENFALGVACEIRL